MMYLKPMAASDSKSAAEAGAPATKIARTLYELLRASNDALVQGEPGAGHLTLIDGNFDLAKVVHDLLNLEHLVKAE
jgi:hypothetical protein